MSHISTLPCTRTQSFLFIPWSIISWSDLARGDPTWEKLPGRSTSWLLARYICWSTGAFPREAGSALSLLKERLSTPRCSGTTPVAENHGETPSDLDLLEDAQENTNLQTIFKYPDLQQPSRFHCRSHWALPSVTGLGRSRRPPSSHCVAHRPHRQLKDQWPSTKGSYKGSDIVL